jgi:tetratricopeptide (TPR) repeat protein
MRAHMAAELGHEADSREAFEALAADDFAALPFDEDWLVCLSFLAEAARFLGDSGRAAILYELLFPYADRAAVARPSISTGSVSGYLGILAATMQRFEDAERHFQDALAMNERMGARPWVAHTQHDYAQMLLTRDAPGDREQAVELLDACLSTCGELGLVALEQRASALAQR